MRQDYYLNSAVQLEIEWQFIYFTITATRLAFLICNTIAKEMEERERMARTAYQCKETPKTYLYTV